MHGTQWLTIWCFISSIHLNIRIIDHGFQDIFTLFCLYFETLEVRFIFSLTFQKLSLAFNLEYISQFFINFNNQWQFWNPHDEQSSNLSLVFEFAEELTEIIDNEKDEDEINFWKISTVFNLKYLNQNFIKLSM